MIARVQEEVVARLQEGHPFAEIEETINFAPGLSEGQRSALWLLAWSYVPPVHQREVAFGHLRALTEVMG